MPLVFPILLGVVVLAVSLTVATRRQRREGMRAAAAHLGFAFVPRHRELEAMLPQVARFGQLTTRHGAWNALRGVWNGVEVVVYDHDLGQRDGDHPRWRTTALFQAADAGLPDFEMRPESLGERLGKAQTGDQIDLPDAPRLDARISLRGQPPEAVRALFSGNRARALGRQPLRLTARSGDGWLAVCRSSGLAQAAELEEFLDEATALAQVLLTAVPPPPPSTARP